MENKDIKNLLCRLSKNDESAFREIFYAFSGKVYSFSLRLTHSETMAEETVQEVFMKIWINRASSKGIQHFPAYLFTASRNLALNLLKRRVLEERAKDALLKEARGKHSDTEEAIIYQDYQQLLNRTISRLPPQQRQVYSLCHKEGLRYEEVAERLNISRLTVKSHMQQALKTIRSQFGHLVQIPILLILFYF